MAVMADPVRFPIRFTPANRVLFHAFLVFPSRAHVELSDESLHVRMGWAFSARIPRQVIVRAGPGEPPAIRFTAGAHGWAGRWLVNGAAEGIVDVELSEPVRAMVSGFPVRLKVLSVSLEDPDAFLAALGAPGK